MITVNPEYFSCRGLGSETNLTCLVTGEILPLMSNISGFVASKEAGERVVKMFEGRAWLDYRPHEPGWVQVKIGTIPKYVVVLELIMEFTRQGVISPTMIEHALVRGKLVVDDESGHQKAETIGRVLPFHLAIKYWPAGEKWHYTIVNEFKKTALAVASLGEHELAHEITNALIRNRAESWYSV